MTKELTQELDCDQEGTQRKRNQCIDEAAAETDSANGCRAHAPNECEFPPTIHLRLAHQIVELLRRFRHE